MGDNAVLYEAVYTSTDAALSDLDVFEHLHDADMIGKYDAAVIDNEAGEPHIVKRVDRPRVNVIPELLGRGALKRSDLHKAAEELSPGEAALVVVGEPTVSKAFETAVTHASKTAKQEFDETVDDLSEALIQAARQ
jgi:hypothetical protein